MTYNIVELPRLETLSPCEETKGPKLSCIRSNLLKSSFVMESFHACCAKRSKVWIPWSYKRLNNIRSTIGKPVISKLDVKTDLDIDNVQKTYDFEFTGFPYSKRNCRCFLLNLNLSPEIEIMIIQRKYQIRLCTAGIMCLPFVSLSLDRKKTNDSWHYTWEGS